MRTVVRYALFQIPGLLLVIMVMAMLRGFVQISDWVMWAVPALFIAADVVLFPFVWRSYEAGPGAVHPMVGKTGHVIEPLDPEGYIRLGGERWKARIAPGGRPAARGEPVVIMEQDGLLLHVKTFSPE